MVKICFFGKVDMSYILKLDNIKASINFKDESVNPDLFGRICGLISKYDLALSFQVLNVESGMLKSESLEILGKIESEVEAEIGQIESEYNVVISW